MHKYLVGFWVFFVLLMAVSLVATGIILSVMWLGCKPLTLAQCMNWPV